MTVSVVLAVYNGEKILGRQLDSIREQTVSPDEVLICDDCSTDQTVGSVAEYINYYHLQGWKIYRNEENYGWKHNFIDGIKRASGDIIFLCDQDDYWYPEKIEEMKKAMGEKKEIFLLACDYDVLYEEGSIKAKVYRKSKEERNGTIGRYTFRSRFFMNPNPGCTYALRKEFAQEAADRWFSSAPHDEFLWLLAAIQDGAFFYNKVLMDFIRGPENASDIRYKDIAMQKKNLDYIMKMLTCMEDYAADHKQVSADHLKKVLHAKVWCNKRKKLLETRNPLRWLAMLPYWKYYNSVPNCLSDLYLVFFGSFKRQRK